MNQDYNRSFFSSRMSRAQFAAAQVAPWVFELVRPSSVLDVGCGTGTWLSEFKRIGVGTVCGLDGNWVDTDLLEIEADSFVCADLKRPPNLEKRFDLVISLEVAEHLPKRLAKRFVRYLVRHGDIVLFSAAIPQQRGVHHVNERWQSYWTELFAGEGFKAVDVLRPRFWDVDGIPFWYRQNAIFFVRADSLHKYPELIELAQESDFGGASLVHPDHYQETIARLENPGFLTALKKLPGAFRRSISYHAKRVL